MVKARCGREIQRASQLGILAQRERERERERESVQLGIRVRVQEWAQWA